MLADASARLVRTVDGFHGDDWSAPSLLPGWNRAHVVAHLALNAEGMARALHGLVADDPTPSRARCTTPTTSATGHRRARRRRRQRDPGSPARRCDAPPGGGRRDARRTSGRPASSARPGGRAMRAAAFPRMRWRELEIHHVDLDAGLHPRRVDARLRRAPAGRDDQAAPPRAAVRGQAARLAPHLDPRGRRAASPVPVVTGPSADLAWWLTGRPAPSTLSCSHGELPLIEGW